MKLGLTPLAVHRRRRARVVFGAVLCIGAVVLVSSAVILERRFEDFGFAIIGGVWVSALLGALLAGAARVRPLGAGSSSVAIGGSADAIYSRALAVRSIGVPLFGVAMMAPLTLHALLELAFVGSLDDFHIWIFCSTVLVTHAHIALGVYGFFFARDVVDGSPEALSSSSYGGRGALGATIAMIFALLPGAVLFMVPPLIVIGTGMAFAPLAFHLVGKAYEREECCLSLHNA